MKFKGQVTLSLCLLATYEEKVALKKRKVDEEKTEAEYAKFVDVARKLNIPKITFESNSKDIIYGLPGIILKNDDSHTLKDISRIARSELGIVTPSSDWRYWGEWVSDPRSKLTTYLYQNELEVLPERFNEDILLIPIKDMNNYPLAPGLDDLLKRFS